jgi:DNA-binding transcriptional ArsR family regulator
MRGRPAGSRLPGSEPDIAAVAAVIAEPARARMLAALMSGDALTATELALEAGVAPSTASGHLAMLSEAEMVSVARQGRHRYFKLVDPDLAAVLERLMGVASRDRRVQRGPRDPALRRARVCFDHLAGATAMRILEGLRRRAILTGPEPWTVSDQGARFFEAMGVDVACLARGRRPLTRGCLDWSERRLHLGGALGAAMLDRLFALDLARREPRSRLVTFTPAGDRWLREVGHRPALAVRVEPAFR